MFDVKNCNDKEKELFLLRYSEVINKDSSYKEYLSLIKEISNFDDPLFIERQKQDNYHILPSILENYTLTKSEKIHLLKEMKKKGFKPHLIPPKEIIEAMNFSDVLNSTLGSKE